MEICPGVAGNYEGKEEREGKVLAAMRRPRNACFRQDMGVGSGSDLKFSRSDTGYWDDASNSPRLETVKLITRANFQ